MHTIKIYGTGIDATTYFFQIAKNAEQLRAKFKRENKCRIEFTRPVDRTHCAVDCYPSEEAQTFDFDSIAYPVAFHYSYHDRSKTDMEALQSLCIYHQSLVPDVIKEHREAIEELQETLNYLEADYDDAMEEQE